MTISKTDDIRLARNSRDSQELEKLSKSNMFYVLIEIAKNINANPETLHSLVQPEKLKDLEERESELILQAVAKNISTSAKTLAYLSKSKSIYVRIYVARNSNTDLETLNQLKEDEWGIVYESAKWNLSHR